jgi:flagellin-like hook-associated protein FlgL
LSLRRRLADDSLTAAEKEALQKEIAELEEQMGMK